jgi:hypothetical protein
VDVEPAGRRAADLDDIEGRPGVALAVPGVLSGELRGEELPLLRLVPRGERQLLLTGAGVDPEEEVAVLGGDWPEGEGGFLQVRLPRSGTRRKS